MGFSLVLTKARMLLFLAGVSLDDPREESEVQPLTLFINLEQITWRG